MIHADYKFSITIHSDDLTVVHCLRALADYSEKSKLKKIAWGNTGEKDWERDGRRVIFHFSNPSYRDRFVTEAKRVLRQNLWKIDDTKDDNPAKKE